MVDARQERLEQWLTGGLGFSDYEIRPASADASFRRYFRISIADESRIVMDAPPTHENSRPFIDIARRLYALGLNVPQILDQDLEQGFLLLSDLGEMQYLQRLSDETVQRMYGDALGALATMQACASMDDLPLYDRDLLLSEMFLFRDWLVDQHLELVLSADEQRMLDKAFEQLAENALAQPQVFVHRDYHSRNLMLNLMQNPGILDFQDAVAGPVTYDLVSLLKDCYISWPFEQVEQWAMGYFELAIQSGILREEHEDEFLKWFHLMGVQRHLKAAGIFARLNLRDGKPGYLDDIPRTLSYITPLATRYREVEGLGEFVNTRVLPALAQKADS